MAIVTAISISAFLLVVSAMVVDLGLLRVDRQTDKSAADAAALAGANGLIPDVNAPVFHPFTGVCQALAYLRANGSGFSTITGSWSDGAGTAVTAPNCSDPADPQLAEVCQPNDRTTWARFTGTTADGRTSVAVQSGYDVAGDSLDDLSGGRFPEENRPAYQGDTGTPTDPTATDYKGCENLAVILGDVRNTKLGVQADQQMHTRIRSVSRVTIAPPESPYALLILERKNCQVLVNGTTGNSQISVEGYETHPGLIHSDSDGSAGSPSCNKPIISGNKPDGVVAHEAPTGGAPGSISTVASTNQSDGLTNVYAGPKPPGSNPVTSGLATRSIVDNVYLSGVAQAKTNANPYLTAATIASLPAPPSPQTWATKACPNNDTWNEQYIFVDCSNVNKNVSMPNAKAVVFTGSISADDVEMPQATRVYVRGQVSPSKGIVVGSYFEMNNGSSHAACPSSLLPTAERARLFLLNSTLTANGGYLRLCNTTVILMGGDIDACLPVSTPTYYPTGTVCPGGQPGTGLLDVGGSATVDWTAPNKDTGLTPAPQSDLNDLEDLALWTESYGTHSLGGGGTVHLAGVFVAPNANPLKINGNPVWQVKDSQFVVRTLEDDGGGVFTMMPDPSLPVAPPSVSFNLVR